MTSEPVSIRLPLSHLSANPLYESFAPPLRAEVYDNLKTSIQKAGVLLYPIIVEFVEAKNSYDVIDGYNRRQIAKELGFFDAPCLQVFTEEQRLEALMANANRRQLTEEQRADLLRRSRELMAKARQTLIPQLADLQKKGQLSKYIGHHNVHYLIGASVDTQSAFYADISLAFSKPTPANKLEAKLLEELKQTRASLAVTKAREQELERRLAQTAEQTEALQAQVDAFEVRLQEEASKTHDAEKTRLKHQLDTLQKRYTTLKEEKDGACRQVHVLEGQVKTAEAEMAAAQMAARDAERRLTTSTRQHHNPQLIDASFDTLLKLTATIESLIHHTSPLHPEDIARFQQHIQLARTRIADLDSALLVPKADIVPLHRHLKPKSPHLAIPKAQ